MARNGSPRCVGQKALLTSAWHVSGIDGLRAGSSPARAPHQGLQSGRNGEQTAGRIARRILTPNGMDLERGGFYNHVRV